MQNFSTLMRKRSKSEGRAFWKLLTSETSFSPPVKNFNWPFQGSSSLVDHMCYFCAFASAHCYLVVTCWERADLLVLFAVLNCEIVTVPFCILCFDPWPLPPFNVLHYSNFAYSYKMVCNFTKNKQKYAKHFIYSLILHYVMPLNHN